MENSAVIVIESFFIDGEPVGKVCQGLLKAQVTFKPKHGHTRLAGRTWKSIDSCQRAVLKHYIAEGPRD